MKLRYIKEYHDCTGKVRRYFRLKGQRDVALPGEPNSVEFIKAYTEALQGSNARPERRRVAHIATSNQWQHWQITREVPGARWQRIERTKCIDDREHRCLKRDAVLDNQPKN